MRTPTVEVLASSLAQPLNSAVHKSDGARFALMLSLLSEGRYAEPLLPENEAAGPLKKDLIAAPAFHLDLSLNRALQQHSQCSFQLLNSLYCERDRYLYSAPDATTPRLALPPAKANDPEMLMREIAQSREQALLMG